MAIYSTPQNSVPPRPGPGLCLVLRHLLRYTGRTIRKKSKKSEILRWAVYRIQLNSEAWNSCSIQLSHDDLMKVGTSICWTAESRCTSIKPRLDVSSNSVARRKQEIGKGVHAMTCDDREDIDHNSQVVDIYRLSRFILHLNTWKTLKTCAKTEMTSSWNLWLCSGFLSFWLPTPSQG